MKFNRRDPILTFTAVEANSTIKLTIHNNPDKISLEYSTNGGSTYNSYTIDQVITLTNVGDSVKFRGNNSTFSKSVSVYYMFVMSGSIRANGDVTSLLNSIGGDCTLPNYCFANLFSGCTSLVKAPILPAMTLSNSCYNMMFYGCTGLTQAPTLPATILATSCYQNMFLECTGLTQAPALPIINLKNNCYCGMFKKCSSLIKAPVLPATTLSYECYREMFDQCTSLITAPELPAITLQTRCYQSMFRYCANLTQAPILPATTLVTGCYNFMFQDCPNLNYVKAMFTSTPSDTYTKNWLLEVSSTGTFIKNSIAEWDVTGANGIPTGWTVETAAA